MTLPHHVQLHNPIWNFIPDMELGSRCLSNLEMPVLFFEHIAFFSSFSPLIFQVNMFYFQSSPEILFFKLCGGKLD